jgi:hypothetical protein
MAEKRWRKSTGAQKQQLKADMKGKQRIFDRAVQRAKRVHWKCKQIELVKLYDMSNSKHFWKCIGNLGVGQNRRKAIPMEVLGKDGSLIQDTKMVLDTWANHFQELLNPDTRESIPKDNLDFHRPEHMTAPEEDLAVFMNKNIEWTEISEAIRKAKIGKASGYDELPLEALRNYNVKCFMLKLFNKCFESSSMPSIWEQGIIVPVPKCYTKDSRIPSNTRGITLASAVCKIYCSVLNARLTVFDEKCGIIGDEQNGFRKGRRCMDHLSALTTITETRKSLKRSTYVAYIDFSKAYDSVDRQKLWFKLEGLGMNSQGKFLKALKSLYSNVECSVRLNGKLSTWFNVNAGLRQGCILSPGLFNLYINDLACKIKSLNKGVKLQNENISLFMYADDIVLISEKE